MARGIQRELSRALRAAGSRAALARFLALAPSTVARWEKKGLPPGRAEQLLVVVDILGQRPKPKTADRPKSVLERALKRAGTAKQLAAEIGLSAGTVQRWVRAGKPSDEGADKLRRFLAREKAQSEAVKVERARLFALLGFAGELDEIPEHETGEGPRSGERTQGWRYSRAWGRELTLPFIQELERWVNSLKRRYPFWQGVVRMLHFEPSAEREFKRSGPNVVIQLGPNVSDLLIDATMTTTRLRSRQQLAGELRGMLEDVIEEGFYAYIVGVTVFNYRMRNEEERKRWLRTKEFRKKQAKKAKKPKKPSKVKRLPPKVKAKALPPKN